MPAELSVPAPQLITAIEDWAEISKQLTVWENQVLERTLSSLG